VVKKGTTFAFQKREAVLPHARRDNIIVDRFLVEQHAKGAAAREVR
jgi:hypothetical protein